VGLLFLGKQQMWNAECNILFLRPSSPGTMKHLHDDVEQVAEFGAEPRLAQAPDQIVPITLEDTAQTVAFVLGERHGGRFLTVMVLLAVWLFS
jgi:hypothetical protein